MTVICMFANADADEGSDVEGLVQRGRLPRCHERGRSARNVGQGDEDGGHGAVDGDTDAAAFGDRDRGESPIQGSVPETVKPDTNADNRSNVGDPRPRSESSKAPAERRERRLKRRQVISNAGIANR